MESDSAIPLEFDIRQDTPAVSVCLITYNHAAYIRQCLDSLLGQQTGFPYEICIGEDESTDGTREICIEYAEKYPDRIRLILRAQNDPLREPYRSQGVYNYIETTRACRGRYVAQCDGDDYWLDPLKLQKQFDIMEADPGVSMVYSDYAVWYELSECSFSDRHERHDPYLPGDVDRVKFMQDLVCMNYHIAASSVFMRTQDLLEVFENNRVAFETLPMGDTTTWCELLEIGRFHYIDEPQIARRCLAESDSSSQSAARKFRFVNDASNLGILLGEKYGLSMEAIRLNKIKNCNRYAMMSGDLAEIRQLYSDKTYVFPPEEVLIFRSIQLPFVRIMVKHLFQVRYRFNNWRFRLPTK